MKEQSELWRIAEVQAKGENGWYVLAGSMTVKPNVPVSEYRREYADMARVTPDRVRLIPLIDCE